LTGYEHIYRIAKDFEAYNTESLSNESKVNERYQSVHKTPKVFKLPVRVVQQLFRIVRFCGRATPFWSTGYLRVFLRAIRLCWDEGFLPKEAFRLGLFDPELVPSKLAKYISRKKMTKLQESINPISWTPLVRDKGIFYRYCMVLGIPIPKLYAIFCKSTAGWSHKGSILTSQDDWKRFLGMEIPPEFVIKPTLGSFGRGLNIYSRIDGEFIDTFGKSYTAEDIYETISSTPQYDSFVIQERLESHPALVQLSGTKFLQTVRITTFVDANSLCHILHAFFKPIMRHNVTDNFKHGQSGNMQDEVSLDDGVLKSAVMLEPNGSGIKTVSAHPKTGVSFEGFQLPLWVEACGLAKETALKFLPMRTIGWDVALTPNGPIILEGNNWWEPLNIHQCMDTIVNILSS